jgi:hypothetical protein
LSWLYRARVELNRAYRERMDGWEMRLMTAATNRVVRPFEWGLEWAERWPVAARLPRNGHSPAAYLGELSAASTTTSEEFFGYATPTDFQLRDGIVRFTSPVETQHEKNNVGHATWFPAAGQKGKTEDRAVIVLPHWNAQVHEHVGLCKGLQKLGLPTLRVSLPYHDHRMPPELERADYAVSSNVARTVDATRQAVIDIRCCIDWLESQGYKRIGIVGTSLGSAYAFLASAHDERLRANVYNMFSLYFADVVWTGLSTEHIRQSLHGALTLAELQAAWRVITPAEYIHRYSLMQKKSLFIYASYDSTFLREYSDAMLEEARMRELDHDVAVIPCGHYTMGRSPFRYLDGYHICNFFLRKL